MSPSDEHDSERRGRIDTALDEYDRLVDADLPVDRDEFLAKYPDIAEELRDYFETIDLLKQSDNATSLTDAVRDGASHEFIGTFGDYELLEEIGRGGMGVVYKARQTNLNRTVAIKVVLSGRRASGEDLERFQREAESVAQLNHPHVVGAFDVGIEEGQPYFAMEFVDGLDLGALLRDQPPAPRQVAEYCKTIAETIHYAHQQGILHRDLKPANIMIDPSGQLKVMDFGLGKRLGVDDHLTETGQILGTLRYMAPEQADGDQSRIGSASDVYSIGAILYELLTGRAAFGSDSTVELLRQIHEQDPIAPRTLVSSVPKDLQTICLKCLQKEPQRRYPTAAALAEDLRRYLAGEPITAVPVGPIERLRKWCQRNSIVAGLILSLISALLAGIIVSTYFAIAWSTAAERNLIVADAERRARLRAEEAEFAANHEARRARTALHAARIAEAFQAWKQHDLLAAESTLDAVPSEFVDSWETRYLRSLCRTAFSPFVGHTAPVQSVAISPDGSLIASGSSDRTVKIWNANSPEELITLAGHQSQVTCVAFSPDGTLLVSGSQTSALKLWDITSGHELVTLTGHRGAINSVAFSPDGVSLASAAGDGLIKLWDITRRAESTTLTGHLGPVTSICFNSDGSQLISGSTDETLKLWDIRSSREITSIAGNGAFLSVAYCPRYHEIATMSASQVELRDASTLQKKTLLWGGAAHSLYPASIAFTPDGDSIAIGGNQSIALMELATRTATIFRGHRGYVRCISINDDVLVSACDGDTPLGWSGVHRFGIWRLDAPHSRYLVPHARPRHLAFNTDGTRIACGGRHEPAATVCDAHLSEADALHTQPLLSIDMPNGCTAVGISPDATRVAAAAGSVITIWSGSNGQRTLAIDLERSPEMDLEVARIAFSNAGDLIGTIIGVKSPGGWGFSTARVDVYRTDSGERLFSLARSSVFSALAFNPSGTLLAVECEESELNGEHRSTLHLCDTTTGRLVMTIPAVGSALAFSPDGSRLAIARVDGIRVWDLQKRTQVLLMDGHTGVVNCLSFCPDGARLLSGSDDCTLRLWDTHTGIEVLRIDEKFECDAVAWAPDATQFAAGVGGSLSMYSLEP